MAPNESLANHSIIGEEKADSRGYTLQSTFSNLKSSGLRGIPFPNIFDWLKGEKYLKNIGI